MVRYKKIFLGGGAVFNQKPQSRRGRFIDAPHARGVGSAVEFPTFGAAASLPGGAGQEAAASVAKASRSRVAAASMASRSRATSSGRAAARGSSSPSPARAAVCVPPATVATWLETTAHLADHVIPPMPVRQWLISVPKRLRGMLADRPAAVNALTKIFLAEIERLLGAAAGVPARAALSNSRRLSSWTGLPISCRRRGSTGTVCRLETIQECLRPTTGSGGP